ncbi:MAG: hypothetical protein KGL43_06545 [Burkholderiales bacterium]|nr:hypothetical protein [Burkholderiales bacterium]MDE2453235.1 hypothetical protein [Burkholderiales bacterium]
MSLSNLTAAANDTLHSCGKTAVTLIDAYHAGGSKVLSRVDAGWEKAVNRGAARLGEKLRHDLVAAQRELTGYYAKGLESVSAKSTAAVEALVQVAATGVERLAGRVQSLEAVLRPLPLNSAIVIAQPFAEASREVAGYVAQRTAQAVSRIEGAAVEVETAVAKRSPAARKTTRRR